MLEAVVYATGALLRQTPDDPPDSVQMWALPLPLPSPRIAELIGVVSERTQLKECVRDDAEHREDKREHNKCEECVHRPPFVARHCRESRRRPSSGGSRSGAAETTDSCGFPAMHNGAAPDATDLGRVDDPCMRKCYGVVWREGTLPLASGKLELRTRGLRLEGLAASRPTAREIAYEGLVGVRVGSVADQIEGRPTVILERRTGSPIMIATVPQPSLVGEIAERLTALQLGPEATRRTASVLPLKKDAHRAVRRLLEAWPSVRSRTDSRARPSRSLSHVGGGGVRVRVEARSGGP